MHVYVGLYDAAECGAAGGRARCFLCGKYVVFFFFFFLLDFLTFYVLREKESTNAVCLSYWKMPDLIADPLSSLQCFQLRQIFSSLKL